MTLPASGDIAMSQINTELGRATNTTISLLELKVKDLAQTAAPVTLPDSFYGKSVVTQTDSRSAAASHANVQYGVEVAGGARWVVVLAWHGDIVTNPGNAPTMTISGVPATRLISQTTGDAVDDACGAAIFVGQPSGTQGTVAGSWGPLSMAIVVLRVVNYACGSATGTDDASPTNTPNGIMNLNVVNKGLCIAAGARSFEIGAGIDWVGLPERGEVVVGSTRVGWAWDYNLTANASYQVQMTPWSAASGANTAVVASFAIA